MAKTTSFDQELQSIAAAFAARVAAVVRRRVLGEHSARVATSAAPSTNGKKRGPGRPKKRGRRSSTDIAVTIDKVLAYITAHPGQRSEEITKKMGGDKGAIKDALARLRATKKLKTKGEKRAMTYSA